MKLFADNGGRGGGVQSGQGRGYVDWRAHPERNSTRDTVLDDTATNPSKSGDTHMTDMEKNAKIDGYGEECQEKASL
jgi:hypothetical protein